MPHEQGRVDLVEALRERIKKEMEDPNVTDWENQWYGSGGGDGVMLSSVLNPESLIVVPNAKIEPSVARDPIGTRYQFERTGYFISDTEDSTPERLVFNRTVTLRDSWAKVKGK